GLAFGRRNAWGTAARAEADALLDRVGLGRPRDTLPGELTYIDQKRLELARALALDPEFAASRGMSGGPQPDGARGGSAAQGRNHGHARRQDLHRDRRRRQPRPRQ